MTWFSWMWTLHYSQLENMASVPPKVACPMVGSISIRSDRHASHTEIMRIRSRQSDEPLLYFCSEVLLHYPSRDWSSPYCHSRQRHEVELTLSNSWTQPMMNCVCLHIYWHWHQCICITILLTLRSSLPSRKVLAPNKQLSLLASLCSLLLSW